MTATTTPAPRAGRRAWLGLALLMLPTMAIGLDVSVLHLAIPQISAQLTPSSTQLLWITDIYGFMIAGLLITMGTIGDRIGRRRLLLIGASAFAAASVFAAYSTSAEMLIAARALLGVTGATLMPSTLSLISNMFPDSRQRALAIAIWTTSFTIAGILGPVAGGVLLEYAWWGAVFLVAVPAMILLLAFGRLLLPEYRNPSPGRLDPASVLLSLVAILTLVYGVKKAAAGGSLPVATLAIVLGLLVGTAFVRRQRTLDDPVMDVSLLTRPAFGSALGSQLVALLTLAGMQFLLLQYLQQVQGVPAVRAGLLIVPASVLSIGANLLAPRLARRVGHARAVAAFLLVTAVGLLLVAGINADAGVGIAVVGFTVLSVAANAVTVLTYDVILSTAPPERAGSASGLGETATELGISLGVAIGGSITAAVYRRRMAADELLDSQPDGVAEAASDTLAKANHALEQISEPARSALEELARDAFTQGVRTASLATAGLVLVTGVFAFVLLPRRDDAKAAPSSGADVDPPADDGDPEAEPAATRSRASG